MRADLALLHCPLCSAGPSCSRSSPHSPWPTSPAKARSIWRHLGAGAITGALLDRLTHHVHILEMNGESYRLKQARDTKKAKADRPRPNA